MIISASYKTDIPTFYGDWFMNRLRAGYCKVYNPYGNTTSHVDLSRDAVDGIVFWTKNIGPFLTRLTDVQGLGYPFVVQHTINGYPRFLESRVIDAERSVRHVRAVASSFGSRSVVWRYDTIVITSETPPPWHIANFTKLARSLEGAVDEVVVSFVHLYEKTLRNLTEAADAQGASFEVPTADEKRQLLDQLVLIAASHGIALSVCAQPDLIVPGAKEARCVDAVRLEAVAGGAITSRLRGNRASCGCYEAKDIGEYDTCPHGCVYCYAVRRQPLAQSRFATHDPESEFLTTPPATARELKSKTGPTQLPLFRSDGR